MKTFKLKTAFNLNLATIIFFGINGYIFDMMFFYIIAGVFLILLPACSTKN